MLDARVVTSPFSLFGHLQLSHFSRKIQQKINVKKGCCFPGTLTGFSAMLVKCWWKCSRKGGSMSERDCWLAQLMWKRSFRACWIKPHKNTTGVKMDSPPFSNTVFVKVLILVTSTLRDLHLYFLIRHYFFNEQFKFIWRPNHLTVSRELLHIQNCLCGSRWLKIWSQHCWIFLDLAPSPVHSIPWEPRQLLSFSTHGLFLQVLLIFSTLPGMWYATAILSYIYLIWVSAGWLSILITILE